MNGHVKIKNVNINKIKMKKLKIQSKSTIDYEPIYLRIGDGCI